MSAYIKQLEDNEKNQVFPVTKAEAVYLGIDTVEDIISDMQDYDTSIELSSDGSIVKTLKSGNKVTTKQLIDGSIVETTVDKNGKLLREKTTSLDDEGKIVIKTRMGE